MQVQVIHLFLLLSIDAAAYQHSQQRPCGWYQMADAAKGDCP